MIARNRDFITFKFPFAGVAELADARDSKSRSVMSVGSIPTAGSSFDINPQKPISKGSAGFSCLDFVGLVVPCLDK